MITLIENAISSIKPRLFIKTPYKIFCTYLTIGREEDPTTSVIKHIPHNTKQERRRRRFLLIENEQLPQLHS